MTAPEDQSAGRRVADRPIHGRIRRLRLVRALAGMREAILDLVPPAATDASRRGWGAPRGGTMLRLAPVPRPPGQTGDGDVLRLTAPLPDQSRAAPGGPWSPLVANSRPPATRTAQPRSVSIPGLLREPRSLGASRVICTLQAPTDEDAGSRAAYLVDRRRASVSAHPRTGTPRSRETRFARQTGRGRHSFARRVCEAERF
jgi:hypothetical protein